MIEIQDLVKKYDNHIVLDIPELSIQDNEIIGLIGNNGAGKTTCFSLMLDLVKPSEGRILLKGQEVTVDEDWKKYTASFLDDSFLIGFLTADEYFEFIGSLSNLTKKETHEFVSQFADFFNGEIIGVKKYIRDLSKGNQKKAGIIASLIGQPEILILDEPFSNLDPSSQLRLKAIINEYSQNRTVLISSHDLSHIMDICTRIILLEKGKVIKDLLNSDNAQIEVSNYFSGALDSNS